MSEPPTVSGFEYRESLSSEIDLANRFGEPVWAPAEWPVGLNPPEFLFMLLPPGESRENVRHFRLNYQLRSMTDGQLLVVSGHRRRAGNLESGLLPLDEERFETWTCPPDQSPHIVVRAPVWDVHVLGSAAFDTGLSVARGLVRVNPIGQ